MGWAGVEIWLEKDDGYGEEASRRRRENATVKPGHVTRGSKQAHSNTKIDDTKFTPVLYTIHCIQKWHYANCSAILRIIC
jgi:hypothetical protein